MAAAAAAASVHKAAEAEVSSREHEQQRALQDRCERLASVREAGRQRQVEEAEYRKRQRAAAGGDRVESECGARESARNTKTPKLSPVSAALAKTPKHQTLSGSAGPKHQNTKHRGARQGPKHQTQNTAKHRTGQILLQ